VESIAGCLLEACGFQNRREILVRRQALALQGYRHADDRRRRLGVDHGELVNNDSFKMIPERSLHVQNRG
jgi:hypothetical protein